MQINKKIVTKKKRNHPKYELDIDTIIKTQKTVTFFLFKKVLSEKSTKLILRRNPAISKDRPTAASAAAKTMMENVYKKPCKL